MNTESSSLGGLVNDQKISELPLNGRNYIDLSLLQAGVAQNKNQQKLGGMQGTVFSSDGAPTISNNFLLDGTSLVNQSGWGTASMSGTTLGMDGIQEYKVVTNAFTAEYGMTMGSQLLMVSKGGSNQFHGIGIRVPAQQRSGCAQFLRPSKDPRISPEQLRRIVRRSNQEGQDLLLRRLRRAQADPGVHSGRRRAGSGMSWTGGSDYLERRGYTAGGCAGGARARHWGRIPQAPGATR